MTVQARRVLISGIGIAGPTLAYWLMRYGFEPTLVERAPKLRDCGYMIDFWGVGLDVAERMDLHSGLMAEGYHIQEVRIVDDGGRRIAGFDADIFRKKLMGRFISIPRGSLARLIFDRVAGKVETIFGDCVTGIDQTGGRVQVRFAHAAPRAFDLVVGAGGLHSTVRSIAFGEQSRFEKFLGFGVAAFNAKDYPRRDEGAYVSYSVPGRQVARYALRDGQTGFLFVFRNEGKVLGGGDNSRAILRSLYESAGWECPEILDAMDASGDVYFDDVSQIHMSRWSSGKVVLAGDAAYCPSLLAGEGSGLAMAGAYLLAGELKRANGDHCAGLRTYEAAFRPYIERRQQGASRLAGWFAPKSRLAIFIRNKMTNLMNVPFVANWATRSMLGDGFALPEYRCARFANGRTPVSSS